MKLTAVKPLTQAYHLEAGELRRTTTGSVSGPRISFKLYQRFLSRRSFLSLGGGIRSRILHNPIKTLIWTGLISYWLEGRSPGLTWASLQ